MKEIKRDFSAAAATWDTPQRVQMSKDVAKALTSEIRLLPEMDVLDFGCGTGLLTLELHPFVRSVTGVDSAQGMLDVLKEKVRERHIGNIFVRHLDIEKGERVGGQYSLIVSNMTLHHIQDIPALLAMFYSLLLPGGYLAITDLDLEKGRFHGIADGVFHNGFDRVALQQMFSEAGFADVRYSDAATVAKPDASGQVRQFSLFLMAGRHR